MSEHESTVTVRFCEVDSYGVAWHGHYVAWMEIGRNSLVQEFDLGVTQLAQAGYGAPVVEMELKYRRPARFDEQLRILTTPRRMETATLAFETRIIGADGTVCAVGRTVHALTDHNGLLQYRLPQEIGERLERMLAWAEGL